MRPKISVPLVVFCLAAAVTAAALVDPVMERLSNTGVFGPGPFTDHSNLDVVPALCVGAAFSVTFVIGLVRRTLAKTCYAPRWLRVSARAMDSATITRLLPAIYAMQIGALFAMETVEQTIVTGHPLGGSIWLGGPIAVSLLLHAMGCVAFTAALSRVLNWLAQTLVHVVTFVCQLVFGHVDAPAVPSAYARRTTIRRPLEDVLERLKGRAPPFYLST